MQQALGSAHKKLLGEGASARRAAPDTAQARDDVLGDPFALLVREIPEQAALYDQQCNVPVCITPILLLDMWEHAFYLQYRNVKADYVKAWWNVVNWADVQERFASARSAQSAGGLLIPPSGTGTAAV